MFMVSSYGGWAGLASECGPGWNKLRGQGGDGDSPLVSVISDLDSLHRGQKSSDRVKGSLRAFRRY